MALASASHGAGGGAKIAIFWRISANFDPIPEGTRQRATGRKTRAFVPVARLTGRLPVTTASGPDSAIAGRLPVAGDRCQLATGSGPVSLGQWARGMARLD